MFIVSEVERKNIARESREHRAIRHLKAFRHERLYRRVKAFRYVSPCQGQSASQRRASASV